MSDGSTSRLSQALLCRTSLNRLLIPSRAGRRRCQNGVLFPSSAFYFRTAFYRKATLGQILNELNRALTPGVAAASVPPPKAGHPATSVWDSGLAVPSARSDTC